MPTFGDALRRVILARGITGAELSEKSGLTRPYVSGLLTGVRKVGPKTLAAVMLVIEDEHDQATLLNAFLEEEVDEVFGHLKGNGAIARQQHLFTKALFSSSIPVDSNAKGRNSLALPAWLEELVDEAVAAGDSDPQVLELIRDLLLAALKHKRANPKTARRR